MAWQEVRLHQPWERMLGFTVPKSGQVAVIAYDGIFLHDLGNPKEVTEDSRFPEGEGIYDESRQVLRLGGEELSVLGLYGGNPILTSPLGEILMLDTVRDILHIQGRNAASTSEHRYRDASGDWAVATFSDDFQFALVGVPYDLYCWRRA